MATVASERFDIFGRQLPEARKLAQIVAQRYRIDADLIGSSQILLESFARLDYYIAEVIRGRVTFNQSLKSSREPASARSNHTSVLPPSQSSPSPAQPMLPPTPSSFYDRFRPVRKVDRSGSDATKALLNEIGAYPRLTREDEKELSIRALQGDERAVTALVNCNLRLVISVVKPFTRGRFDILELFSPGSEGLLIAARRYNWEVGVPFGSYAPIWIKQRVMKYVAENGASVRIPHYRAAIVNKVLRENGRLRQALGREPTLAELWEHMQEVDPKATYNEVEEVFRLMEPPLELDAPMKDEGGTVTFGAYFGESVEEAEDRLMGQLNKIDLKRAAEEALAHLPEREALVLTWNLGLMGHMAMDLEQIAARIGVTRERTRQIRASALKKLRALGTLERFL